MSVEWKATCMICVYDTYGVWVYMIDEDGGRGRLDPSRRKVRWEVGSGWGVGGG